MDCSEQSVRPPSPPDSNSSEAMRLESAASESQEVAEIGGRNENLAGGLDDPNHRVDGPVYEGDFLPGGRLHSE